MNKLGNPYAGSNGTPLVQRKVHSFTTVRVLPELYGLPVNDVTLLHMEALKPTCIRMSTGEIMSDAHLGRMTVMLDTKSGTEVIEYIEIEVAIPLIPPFNNGHQIWVALDKLRKVYL
ncbi:MAG: hypothetical protein ACN6OP_19615 [Pseudomonadales bacterium]